LSGSSGTKGSLSECLDSCELTLGCRSAIFYYDTNYCSHVSTACANTKEASGAVSFTIHETITPAQLANEACNAYDERWLTNSPGTVPSLDVCTQLCQESYECRSVTLFENDYCSHFSTTCSNTESTPGATAVRLAPATYSASWALAAGYGRECDFLNGETYLASSSGTKGSLSACLDSCEGTPGCRSAIFYYDSSWCSHVSTACTNTKEASGAVSFTKPETTTTTPTTTTTTS